MTGWPGRTGSGARGPDAQARGRAGLAAIGLSIVATFVVAVSGISVMEPALPGRSWQPPWAFDLHISAYLAVGLAAASLAAGAAGLVLVLRAMRGGWRIPARALLLAGIVAAAVLTLVPPFGSSDQLSYAAYGRMVATGHNPYLTTPADLARLGDPVARAVQDWYNQVSVYGPLASGIQGLASLIGGASVRLTVFVLGVVNLIAFSGTGVLLYRMTSGQQDRQLRAMLLWTANPLLLQVLVAGAHVDVQMIACCVAGVAVVYRQVTPARAAAAGVLIGLGFAVKVTAGLVGLGIAIALCQQLGWRRGGRPLAGALGALAGGFAVVAATALAIGGAAMLKATSTASDMVSIGSPWRGIRSALKPAVGGSAAGDIVKYGAVVLAVALVVLLIRGLPRVTGGPMLAVIPLALALGWLFAWPYVLPWYDALGWALLALVPASDVDWLLLARTTALGFAYLPARTLPARHYDVKLPQGLHWVQPVFRNGVSPVVLTVTTVWLVLLMWRAYRGAPRDQHPDPVSCLG
ncbi:MAG TPA: polyprenol phosphomannose-dependent alpha 1,6 mannosyltransferase MptB [Streptosporangiaceae bacterium]|nr:polyprenol phosphomannose-dependent alpha 1,6 mannosyltransferase MptB [Streptosporangiaceae bacterium]